MLRTTVRKRPQRRMHCTQCRQHHGIQGFFSTYKQTTQAVQRNLHQQTSSCGGYLCCVVWRWWAGVVLLPPPPGPQCPPAESARPPKTSGCPRTNLSKNGGNDNSHLLCPSRWWRGIIYTMAEGHRREYCTANSTINTQDHGPADYQRLAFNHTVCYRTPHTHSASDS
jgi:hypothetical protein